MALLLSALHPHHEQQDHACGNATAVNWEETFIAESNIEVLTEQYNDADEDRDDGAGAEAGGRHGSGGAAVPVVIAGTNLDPDGGAVGQRRVPGIGHNDGDLVHAGLQVGDPEFQLRVVTWKEVCTPRGGGIKETEEDKMEVMCYSNATSPVFGILRVRNES